MNTKDRKFISDREKNDYLVENKVKDFDYSLNMVQNCLSLLSEDKHIIDLYKKSKGTEQSTMQIRVYDKNDSLITAYTQCYGNLKFINVLAKREFVSYKYLPNNYLLKFTSELDLIEASEALKDEILQKSMNKNRIVVYWNVWSNHFSKIMLKKLQKYISKYDEKMENTFVLLLNNDNSTNEVVAP